MGKKLFRLTAIVLGVLLALFLILTAILYANREKFSGLLVSEINKQLTVPVEVSSVDVSLRKFPSASFVFKDVFSQGAYSQPGDTLVYARELYLQFSIWQVLFSSVSVNELSLENAIVHIHLRDRGRDNFRIWREDTTSSGELFVLEQVNLRNVKTKVHGHSADFYTDILLDKLVFNGNFETSNYQLESKGALVINELTVGERKYLAQMPLKTEFQLSGYPDSTLIKPANISWEGQNIEVKCVIGEQTRIRATANSLALEKLQNLLATQGWYSFEEAKLKGKAVLRFDGRFADGVDPQFKLDFTADDAALNGYHKASITNINCSGTFSNEKGKRDLKLESFKGSGKTGNIEGSLFIKNMASPFVDLKLRSDLDLAEWLLLFPIDTIQNPEGKLLVDLNLKNQFSSLSNIKATELKKAVTQGNITIEDAEFRFKGSDKSVNSINGELSFSGNDLKVQRLYFKTGKSDIFLDGILGNVLNFLVLENEGLTVDCRVKSQEIDLSDFVTDKAGGKQDHNLDFAKNLKLDLILEIDRFAFEDFEASSISGNLSIDNQKIKVGKLTLKADEGTYVGQFSIDLSNADRYEIVARLQAENINIHDLFVSFRDFGQDAIKANNIYGEANSDINFKAFMRSDLSVITESVDMTAVLQIKDGNLKNYEPMLALSRFADISELEDVRFRSLNNTISIRDSRVIIPSMDVESNVLSLKISGTHDFNNMIDYSMRLKLDDVLFSKRKRERKKSEFDEHLVEIDNEDEPYIYVKMSGTADDPDISLDRESMGSAFSRDLKQQGQEIKDIFKKEDSDKKDKNDPGIIFEWDEGSSDKKQN